MATITEYEAKQIEQANATGQTPVVFVHGLWLLPSSWDRWAEVFEEAGYTALTPGWPDDPETVEEANANPEVFAEQDRRPGRRPLRRRSIEALDEKPAVIGHSFGGLLTQILAGRGARRGLGRDRPGAVPRRAAAADLGAEVRAARCSATRPTATARCRSPTSSSATPSPTRSARTRPRSSTTTFAVPAPGAPLFQAATANLNPWTEAKVDTKNPDRGPLLIISGEKDHTVPWAIANASYKKQKRNEGVTEIVEIPGRGHALTIDSGWREVADTALDFVKRFT